MIFWDWDDTLLCSSVLSKLGCRLSTEVCAQKHRELLEQLQLLESSVIEMLRVSLRLGEVHIITNAENRWVELSAKKWLPGVVPYLNQCVVFSARSAFESNHPRDPFAWKANAFQNALQQTFGGSKEMTDVFSFGDSDVERRAIIHATGSMDHYLTKTVKFVLKPTVEQLRLQHNCVLLSFGKLLAHEGQVDVQITLDGQFASLASYEGEGKAKARQKSKHKHAHKNKNKNKHQDPEKVKENVTACIASKTQK